LYPGQQDEPIHCSLEPCYIDELQTYEALSYVWGDASLTSPIYIGPETPGAGEAIQTLERLVGDPDLHWCSGSADRLGPSIENEQAFGLHAWFRQCTWWTRIWTVQEFSLPMWILRPTRG
jgi:hypothetical protein